MNIEPRVTVGKYLTMLAIMAGFYIITAGACAVAPGH